MVWQGQNRLDHGFDAAVVGDAPGDGVGRPVVAGESGVVGEPVEFLRLAGVRRRCGLANGGAQGNAPAVRERGCHMHQPSGRQVHDIAVRQAVPLAKGANGGYGGGPVVLSGLLAGCNHGADCQQLIVQLTNFWVGGAGT